MLGIGRSTTSQEVETKTTPALAWIKITDSISPESRVFFAFEEFTDFLNLLPCFWYAPGTLVPFGFPGRSESCILEIICPVVEIVAISVNRNPIGFSIPCTNGSFQITDIIIHFYLLFDPIWHFGGKSFTADIAFERRPHFQNIKVHRFSCNGLLQTSIVVCLCQINPFYFCTRILLPGFQKSSEQEVVQILIVQSHEG